MFHSRGDRDLGVAFQAPPGSQASSRGEAKDSALLSSRDAGLLESPERPHEFSNYDGKFRLSAKKIGKYFSTLSFVGINLHRP